MSIEKTISDLTAAINNLTAAAKEIMEKLDGGAPAACPAPSVEEKPRAKKAASKKSKEEPPKPTPAATLDACAPPPPTLDELKAALGAAVTDCGRPAVLALLKQYGSDGKAGEVAEADRAACIIAVKAMASGEKKKDADDDF